MTQVLVPSLGIIATLVVAVLLFKCVDRVTRPKYKIVIRMIAMMLGSFATVATAAMSITLVVESINKPNPALVRRVRAVPIEPDAEELQVPVPEPVDEFDAPPLRPGSTPPPQQERQRRSAVVKQAPPTEIQKPTEAPRPTLSVNREQREHELQAP